MIMDLSIKLDAYWDIDLVHYKKSYHDLVDTIKSIGLSNIAIAPANKIAEEIINELKKQGYGYEEIYIYDMNPDKMFPLKIQDYSKVKTQKPERVFIVSSRHAATIRERFISLGIKESSIIDFAGNIPDLLSINEALDYILTGEDGDSIESLFNLLGERNLVIINCRTLFYDVNEKVKILKRDLNMDVVWIDHALYPAIDENLGIIRANIVDIINYIKHRKRRDNIIYFSVNPLWRLVFLYLMRTAFPEIKIILYKYDWLNLFCPYEHKEVFQRFLNLPMSYIEGEYKILDLILKGEIVDGILYKDGGYEFHALKKFPLPKLFFPAFLPQRLYQEPTRDVKNPNKFIYLGKLFSPLDYTPELFIDAFLFDVFKDIAEHDFFIDVYYVDSPGLSINEYKNFFGNNGNVRIIEGKPLNDLLPEIAGKYHWGYLVNNYRSDFSVIKQHVEAALPARIFAYLALGIPVVVSEELKYTSDFVRKHGIGVVISTKDIKNIGSILRNIDYIQLQKNVLDVRERLCLENQKDKFIDFIFEILLSSITRQ
jgi:hypothetical protein